MKPSARILRHLATAEDDEDDDGGFGQSAGRQALLTAFCRNARQTWAVPPPAAAADARAAAPGGGGGFYRFFRISSLGTAEFEALASKHPDACNCMHLCGLELYGDVYEE